MEKLLFADLLDNDAEMAFNTINNYHDLPEFVIVEFQKKDELIKSQQSLITELQKKLSRYCQGGNTSFRCDSECKFAKNGESDNGTQLHYLTNASYEKAAVKIQRAYRKYLNKKAFIMDEKAKRTKDLIKKMSHEDSDFIEATDSKMRTSLTELRVASELGDLLIDESSSHFENVLEGIQADDETNGSFNSNDEEEEEDDEEEAKEAKNILPLVSSSNNSTLRRAMSTTDPAHWPSTPPLQPPSLNGCHSNLEGTLKRDQSNISKIFSSSSNSIYPPSPDLNRYPSPLHKADQSRSFYSPRPSLFLDDFITNRYNNNIVEMLHQNNHYKAYYNNNIHCCCSKKDCFTNTPSSYNHLNHFYDDVNGTFYQSSLTLSSASSSSSSCLAPSTPSTPRFIEYQQQTSLDPAIVYDHFNQQNIINNNNNIAINQLQHSKSQEHKSTTPYNNNNSNNNQPNGLENKNSMQQTRTLSERNRKRLYRIGLNLFNKSPSRGIDFMVQHRFMEKHPRAIAKFLISRKGLSRRVMGEYMGASRDRLAADVLRYFSEELDLTGLQIDVALRLFQSQFRISGEAQMIERFMQVFSSRYCECNPHLVGRLVRSEDTIFLLSFAIIMLNTDLHNPSIKPERRMTLQCFLKNLKGLDEGSDISSDFLVGIYERVREHQFSLLPDHTNQVVVLDKMITGTKESLVTMHRRFVCHCRMDEVADLNKIDKPGSHVRGIFLFNDLLIVTKFWMRKKKESHHVVRHSIALQGVSVYLLETSHYKHGIRLKRASDDLELVTLCARDSSEQMRFVEDLKESILETEKMEEYLLQPKEPVVATVADNRFSKDSGVMELELGSQAQQQQQMLLQQQHHQQQQQQQFSQQQQQQLQQQYHSQNNLMQQNSLYQQGMLYRQHLLQQHHVMQQQIKQQKKQYLQQQQLQHQQQQQQQLQNVILQTLTGNNSNNGNNNNNNAMDPLFTENEAGDKRSSRTSVDSGLSSIGSFNNQQQLANKTTSVNLLKKI